MLSKYLVAAPLLISSVFAGDPQDLKDCLRRGSVPFVVAGDADYANETATYNLRTQFQPAAVAIPNDDAHVAAALACAASSGIQASVKGGGHSYAGFSLGGKDGLFTISVENFQDVILGPSGYPSSIAKVGAGLRLGNLATSLYNQGKVGVPHGTCPGVGIGGHATHGGYGYNSRAWGLTLDAIVALDAVLPNGTVVTVDAQSNPDLWYALRGAAESFAVVTNFYLQTFPVPQDLTYFAYSFGANFFTSHTAEEAASYLTHLQNFAANSSVVDSRLTLGTYLDAGAWSTSGLFHGPLTDFQARIAPELLRGLPTPANTSEVKSVSWTDSLTILAGSDSVIEPLGAAYSIHDDFYANSLVVPEPGLTPAASTAFFDYIITKGTKTPNGWYTIFDLYGGASSKVNAVSPSSSAYSQRDTLWVFQNYGYAYSNTSANGTTIYPSPFPSDIRPFVEGLRDVIPPKQQETRFGAYANYIDDSLTPDQAHDLYFGAETYQKLLGIKKSVDPHNVIGNPLSVGTGSGGL